jgi:hypothetical protein
MFNRLERPFSNLAAVTLQEPLTRCSRRAGKLFPA